jgi:molecular chaperone GrpE
MRNANDKTQNTNTVSDNPDKTAEQQINDNQTSDTPKSELELACEKIEQLEIKVNELNDKYLRQVAEMQNNNKRNLDEMKKTRDYAVGSFAKELVAVKDYLEMALQDNSGNFENLKTGVNLTLNQLQQVFENNKIKEVVPKVKDKLDPNLHQSMETVEVAEQESNTIVSVMQKGYTLHDRILRPAMVKVAK